jgi:hypothetical protein
MDSELRCSHCGASLKPGDRFCPNCGKPVDDAARASFAYAGTSPERDGGTRNHRRRSAYWRLGCGCGLALVALLILGTILLLASDSLAQLALPVVPRCAKTVWVLAGAILTLVV